MPARNSPRRQSGADQLLSDRVDELDELVRQQAERYAASDQPQHARALPAAGVVRLRQPFLARLAEEDDAEELDHRVARQRGDERDHGGDHRNQHVEHRVG
jgi:hypothetical protein